MKMMFSQGKWLNGERDLVLPGPRLSKEKWAEKSGAYLGYISCFHFDIYGL